MILPSATVTRTWASPYWVATASPVAVPETRRREEPVEDEPVALDGVAVAAVAGVDAAVAVGTAGVCGWKARTPAVPATVAARTMGDRRMTGGSVSEGEGLEVDAGPGTPARSSSAASACARASGPQR